MRKIGLPTAVAMVTLCVAASLVGGAPARAATKAWNQDEAKKLASSFVLSLDKIALEAESATQQETAIQQRMRDGTVNNLRRLREIAGAYSKQLRKGRGRSATELFFGQVQELYNELRRGTRDVVPGTTQAANLVKAEEIIEQLAEFYED